VVEERIMAKKVEFYFISLNNDLGITDYSVHEFFDGIEQRMIVSEEEKTLVREINGKRIRLFPFSYTTTHRQLVIPFGKLKNRNPYWENEEHQLEEVPMQLYDVNSLGYDDEYNVMILTTNKQGPSAKDIEEYLNTFLPQVTGLSVKIEPIMYNTGIEAIRRAEIVRKIILDLDLWQPLNNFYVNEINRNQPRTVLSALRGIAEIAKDEGESKTLSLTLGMGNDKGKDASLNLENLLYLLERLNVNEDFVREIRVYYKNGKDEKIDKARLKQSQILLSYNCRCSGNQVSPQALIDNINAAVEEKVAEIVRAARIHFENIRPCNLEEIQIVANWNNEEV
jgi:hypothetical protein